LAQEVILRTMILDPEPVNRFSCVFNPPIMAAVRPAEMPMAQWPLASQNLL